MTDQILRGADARVLGDFAFDRAAARSLGMASGGEPPLAPKRASQRAFHWVSAPDAQAYGDGTDAQDEAAA
jgi:hypothetical protein